MIVVVVVAAVDDVLVFIRSELGTGRGLQYCTTTLWYWIVGMKRRV